MLAFTKSQACLVRDLLLCWDEDLKSFWRKNCCCWRSFHRRQCHSSRLSWPDEARSDLCWSWVDEKADFCLYRYWCSYWCLWVNWTCHWIDRGIGSYRFAGHYALLLVWNLRNLSVLSLLMCWLSMILWGWKGKKADWGIARPETEVLWICH